MDQNTETLSKNELTKYYLKEKLQSRKVCATIYFASMQIMAKKIPIKKSSKTIARQNFANEQKQWHSKLQFIRENGDKGSKIHITLTGRTAANLKM